MKKAALRITPYFGMILLQGLHAPTTVAVMTGNAVLPLFIPVVTFFGLCCYMVEAIRTDNTLYKVSNGIGMVISTCLAAAIIYT